MKHFVNKKILHKLIFVKKNKRKKEKAKNICTAWKKIKQHHNVQPKEKHRESYLS